MASTPGASSEQNGCLLVKTLKRSTLTFVQSNSMEQSMSVHYSEATVSQSIPNDCNASSYSPHMEGSITCVAEGSANVCREEGPTPFHSQETRVP